MLKRVSTKSNNNKKLATLVEGDPKAPFSIARGSAATPFPGLHYFIRTL